MATPTKNSAEEAESPTRCVVVTERLQMVALAGTSGTWLNLEDERRGKMGRVAVRGGWGWGMRGAMGFSPEGVVEVGV